MNWAAANQAWLVAEFERLKARLKSGAQAGVQPVAESTPLDPPPAIDWLAGIFGLTAFERDLLLLCAGVEMDSQIADQCAEAYGHAQRSYVTFGLALAVLPEPHWSALTPARPLRRYRLVEAQPGYGLANAPLRIDERILHLLAGINLMDSRLESIVRPSPAPQLVAEEHRAVAEEIIRLIESQPGSLPAFCLCGDDPLGQEDVAGLVAERLGRQLLAANFENLPTSASEASQFNLLWQREAVLLPAALLLQCADATSDPSLSRFAAQLPGLLFLASRGPLRLDRPFLRFDINKPKSKQQKALWEQALGPVAAELNGEMDALASQFRLSARMIAATGHLFSEEPAALVHGGLWDACRSLSRPKLSDLALRIEPCAAWDDLVLPAPQIETLRQIASQIRHRMKVCETWGFSTKGQRGLGVSTLFAGDSGTGKTLAAEVLARELDLDLYRIDLSAVVSKYIGETEKNLKQVFDAAEESGAILLFDEADALFGKRSEVKDSRDRYANIEVSYLLQRMEAYQGLAILTTNLKSALDKAFQRRLSFTVTFPFPDAAQREAIWTRIFPVQTPTRGLDHRRLAQLNVTGGNIRSMALNAAFLAAADGAATPVGMSHLLRAARCEAEKIERPLSEAETRGWI